jgi:hypothetical protein
MWSAEGSAVLANARSLDVADPGPLAVRSNDDSWGGWFGTGSIQAQPREYAVSVPLWAEVALPDNARLEGKVVELKVRLQVTYPKYVEARRSNASETGCWWNTTTKVEEKVEVRVAPRAALRWHSFLSCLVGLGLLVLTAGSFVLGQLARHPCAAPLSAVALSSP